MKGRVIVGLSGGVDSSVAAYLLKSRGYEVVGASVLLYNESDNPYACCGIGSVQMAKRVAIYLGIEFYEIDCSEGFKRDIIGYFVDEYKNNRTPNPCLFCNRDYKIKALFDLADKLGAEFVATGHYIRKGVYRGVEVMRRGLDRKKDQSYFMFRVPKAWIRRLVFPVGGLTKEGVRDMAFRVGLPTAKKPESQDLCFVDGNYGDFLVNKAGLKPKAGRFIYRGRVVGEHRGTVFYTIGQRRGLNVSLGKRVYVKGFLNGDIILGDLNDVLAYGLTADNLNWHYYPGNEFEADVQVRAGVKTKKAKVFVDGDKAVVKFIDKQFAPAPGQGVAFYINDFLIGGGTIKEVLYCDKVY